MKLFSLYDNASGTYDVPRVFPSTAAAKRAMIVALTDGLAEAVKAGVTWARWPENFSLFEIADFDPATAAITVCPVPQLVLNLWTVAGQSAHAGAEELTE